MGKHSEPLGKTNPYLVVASDEGLSGSYCSSAVHFQVQVVFLPHKYLKDVQHLERRDTIKTSEKQCEKEESKRNTERKRGGEVWIISKRIRAD